jgi:hypothetical protein
VKLSVAQLLEVRCVAGADLSSMDLRRRNLSTKDLSGCDLSGCNLSGCVLTHCRLRGARLEDARLDGCRGNPADSGADGVQIGSRVLHTDRRDYVLQVGTVVQVWHGGEFTVRWDAGGSCRIKAYTCVLLGV